MNLRKNIKNGYCLICGSRIDEVDGKSIDKTSFLFFDIVPGLGAMEVVYFPCDHLRENYIRPLVSFEEMRKKIEENKKREIKREKKVGINIGKTTIFPISVNIHLQKKYLIFLFQL